MNTANMKNMVILKNLPSNIIDEAFIVLKENKKAKKLQYVDKNMDEQGEGFNHKSTNPNNYVVKEAEMIISKYITDIEERIVRKKNENIQNKYKKLLVLTIFLGAIVVMNLVVKLL